MPVLDLKLRARSSADLALISGLLQDALICGIDMSYEPVEKRFVAVFNRFCWEQDAALQETEPSPDQVEDIDGERVDPKPGCYHRTHSGLVVDRVRAVQSKKIDVSNGKMLLNLLSIHALDGHIELLFSGGAALRLKTRSVLAHLKDLGEPWPTRWRPHHGHDAEILAEEAARKRVTAAP